MEADAHELRELAADLADVPRNLMRYLPAAVETSARHVKNEWAGNLEDDVNRRLRHAPKSIDYDMRELGGMSALGLATGIEAEIGPNLARRQGATAGWFEEGSVDGVPATRPGQHAYRGALREFDLGLRKASDDALRDLR